MNVLYHLGIRVGAQLRSCNTTGQELTVSTLCSPGAEDALLQQQALPSSGTPAPQTWVQQNREQGTRSQESRVKAQTELRSR